MYRGSRFNAEGYYDETAYQAIKNVEAEERKHAGNNGADKVKQPPSSHKPVHHKKSGRTPEQVVHHNEKMAARREARKSAREAAGIVPAYRQNLKETQVK